MSAPTINTPVAMQQQRQEEYQKDLDAFVRVRALHDKPPMTTEERANFRTLWLQNELENIQRWKGLAKGMDDVLHNLNAYRAAVMFQL